MAEAPNIKQLDGRYFGRDVLGFMRTFLGLKTPDLRVGDGGSERAVLGANSVQNAATGSTATTLVGSGTINITSTAAKDFSCSGPQPGQPLTIAYTGGTTLACTVTFTAGTIQTTVGSSANKVSMDNPGNVLELRGLTTALWALISKSTASVLSTA